MNVYELIQDRASVYEDMKALMDQYEGKPMDALDKEKFSNLENRFDELTDQITAMNKMAEREKLMDQAADRKPVDKKNEVEKLFARAITGDSAAISQYMNAAPTLGSDAQAGYLTAPVAFVNQLIEALDDNLFMREISYRTPTLGEGQSLGYPYVAADAEDTDWVSEVADAGDEDTIAFGRREFKPNRMAKELKISRTLMRHAAMAEPTLTRAIVQKVGVTQEKAYLTGNGSGKPLGIFTASNDGIPTSRDVAVGSTSGLTADGMIDVVMALKQQYRKNAVWVMHRDILKEARKLKDGDGRYVWQPSLIPGQPDTLLGKAVYESEFAPNTISSGTYGAVFGDFQYYWICDCDTLFVQVLNEVYAKNNKTGYLVNYAGDGAPVLGEAFARLKFSAS